MTATVESLTIQFNDAASAGAQAVAVAMGKLADATDRATAASDTSDQAIRRRGPTFDAVNSKIDGAAAALARLEAVERTYQARVQTVTATMTANGASASDIADKIVRLGVIRDQDAAKAKAQGDAIESKFAPAAAATDALGKSTAAASGHMDGFSLSTAGATREMLVLGHEVISGNFSRIPGSLIVMAERAGGLHDIISGVGAALTSTAGVFGVLGVAGLAALTVLGVEAQHEADRMGDLRQQLRLTHDDYGALADAVNATSRSVSATSNIALTDAQRLGQTIASSRYLGDFRGQLDQLTRSAADYARVTGGDVPKAGELFREAIDDPAAAAKKLAEEGLPSMDAGLLRIITRLADSGQNAQATALTFSAIQRATQGATHDLSPLSTELDRLKQAFKGGADGSKGFGESLGEWADLQTSRVVRGLNNVIEVLSKANAAVRAAIDAAATAAPNGVDEYGRSYSSAAAASPTNSTSYLSQADPSIQALLKASAAQYQVEQELLARLQLSENRAPGASGAYSDSPTGAVGPMQVLNSTFNKLPGFAGQNIRDNATNINAGTSLFATLLQKYGDPYLAVLAYHDGETLIDHVIHGDTQRVGVYNGQTLTGTIDRPYAPSDAAITQAQQVTRGYSGTGLAYAAPRVEASSRRSDLDNTQGYAAAGLPASVSRLLGASGSDGTPEDTAEQIAAKLTAAKVALADLTAQGVTSGPVFDRVNNVIAHLGAEAYSAVSPLVAQTRAMTDQLGPLQANEGAQRKVAQAIQELAIADAQRGRSITPQEIDEKTTATLRLLAVEFDNVVKATDLQTAANTRLVASVDGSQPSLIAATNREKALAQARQDFLPGPDQDAAVDRYTAALNRQSASAADLATVQKQFDQRDQLQTLQAESDLLGKNADEQAKALALLKEKQDLIKRGADLQSAASQADLANVAAIADATAAYNQQKAALGELSGFISNTFDTISNAITTAFAQGGLSAVKFGDIAKSVVSAIEAEFVKLALLNPLKNALFGTNDTTLSTIGGLVGKLFGNTAADVSVSATGGATAAGVSALESLGFFNPISGSSPAQVAATSNATGAGTTSGSGSLLNSFGTIGTLAKGLDYLSGGKLVSGVVDGVKSALGYTPGQSIGSYVGSLVGETAGVSLGTNAATIAAEGAGLTPAATAATSTAYSVASGTATESLGVIGQAAGQIAQALPYIGVAISVVSDLIQGNYRGAGLVAGGAVVGAGIGTAIFPGPGTAIGAAVGAAIGGIVDLVFPQHPLNPYQNTEADLVNGQIVAGKSVSQLESTDPAKQAITDFNAQLQGFLGAVGLKIADADTAVGQFGSGIKGLKQTTNLNDLIAGLHFDNADPNDTSNFAVAKHSLISETFPDLQSLATQLSKIAGFSDAMDAVGIQLASVGKDLTSIQIASVSGAGQGNDLRDALAHDLPGQTFADTDALDAEINKVNQFVNGTIPGLVAGIQQPASDFLKSVLAIATQYELGKNQAEAYGLSIQTIGKIQAAETTAIAQLYDTEINKVGGIHDQDASLAGRLAAVNGDAESAELMNYDLKAKDEMQSFRATLDALFGAGASQTADYLAQINQLEQVQGAERVAIVQKYASAITTAIEGVGGIHDQDASFAARVAAANGDQETADLMNYDLKARDEMIQFRAALDNVFGAANDNTIDYLMQINQLEAAQGAERVAIVQKYADQAAAAQTQALQQAQSGVASLLSNFTTYAQKLEVGSDSPLSPQAQYDLASSQFNAVAGAAQAGDFASAGKLTSYADSLISASRAVNGSGVGYAADVSRILDALSNTSLQSDALTNSSLQSILQNQTSALVAATNDTTTAVVNLQAEVAALRREMAGQTRALALAS